MSINIILDMVRYFARLLTFNHVSLCICSYKVLANVRNNDQCVAGINFSWVLGRVLNGRAAQHFIASI